MKSTPVEEIDWHAVPSNIALLLIFSGIGFMFSSGNIVIAIFTFFIFAPLYEWRKAKPQEGLPRRQPLTRKGKALLYRHLEKAGQIHDES